MPLLPEIRAGSGQPRPGSGVHRSETGAEFAADKSYARVPVTTVAVDRSLSTPWCS